MKKSTHQHTCITIKFILYLNPHNHLTKTAPFPALISRTSAFCNRTKLSSFHGGRIGKWPSASGHLFCWGPNKMQERKAPSWIEQTDHLYCIYSYRFQMQNYIIPLSHCPHYTELLLLKMKPLYEHCQINSWRLTASAYWCKLFPKHSKWKTSNSHM